MFSIPAEFCNILPDGRGVYTFHPMSWDIGWLKILIDSHICTDENKRKENYLPGRLNLDEALAISIVIKDDELTAFATAIHSPFDFHYVRVVNRYWIAPEWRQSVGALRPSTAEILEQQLHLLEKYHNNWVKTVFVSREAPTKRYMTQMCERMNENSSRNDWVLNDELMLVAPNPDAKSCWQHVIYSGEKPAFETISEEQWKTLALDR